MKRYLTVLLDDSGGSLDRELTIFGPDGNPIAEQRSWSWGDMFEEALQEAGIIDKED